MREHSYSTAQQKLISLQYQIFGNKPNNKTTPTKELGLCAATPLSKTYRASDDKI